MPRMEFDGATSPEHKFVVLFYGFLSVIDWLEDMDLQARDMQPPSLRCACVSLLGRTAPRRQTNSRRCRGIAFRSVPQVAASKKRLFLSDSDHYPLDFFYTYTQKGARFTVAMRAKV